MRMRASIVGCGAISRVHLSALRELRDVDLVAVCDRDRYRARELAEAAGGGTAYYTDLGAMLAEARPDALHVLTPPTSHAALAIQAMEAGVHALVEKPMALDVAQAEAMIAAARQNGVSLCANHNYLYKPSVLRARALVAEGAIGEVVHVSAYYGLAGEEGSYGGGRGHWAWRLPGGAFTNFLPHLIYLVGAFVGEVSAVGGAAVARPAGPGSPATELSALVEGASATATLVVSMRARPYAKYVQVYGTRGMVEADLVREVCTVHRESELPRMVSKVAYSVEEGLQLLGGTARSTGNVLLGRWRSYPGLRVLVRDFYRSLREGTEPPVTASEGREMVRVLELVRERLPEPAEPPRPPAEGRVPQGAAEERLRREGLPGRALVTGATGTLGGRLVAALWRAGVDVVALVRDRSRASPELEARVGLVSGDVRSLEDVRAAVRGCSVVFHCAALTTNGAPWSQHHETNVVGTENVLRAAREAGVRRVVHASSVAVYGLAPGNRDGSLDEAAPYGTPDAWAHYMRAKIEADRLARRYAREEDLDVVVLRLGVLYGPGGGRSPGKGLARVGPVRLVMGGGRNAMPYTHVDNAVDAMLLAAVSGEAAGKAYNVVDEPQRTVREAIRLADGSDGRRPVVLGVPTMPLTLGAALLEWRARRKGQGTPPRLTRYVVRSATRDLRYDTRRIREELGWRPRVGLEEGLRSS